MFIRLTRILSVLCICLAFSYTGHAQSGIYIERKGWSIGSQFGMSDLWGDVGTKSPIDHYTNSKYFNKVTFMGGLMGRYTFHPCFAVRLEMNYGSLFATDQWNYDLAKGTGGIGSGGSDAVQRYVRNQNAKDVMVEGMTLFEFTPGRVSPENEIAHKRNQPYIAAGIAIFHYTPYSTVGLSPHYVQTYNLDLEGQGWGSGYPPKQSLWQPAIPLAIGYRWDVGEHLNLGVEFMYRYTFTDYLDGVSGKYVSQAAYNAHLSPANAILADEVADKAQYATNPVTPSTGVRGNSSNNDSYSTISFTIFYKINTKRKEWWH